MKPTPYSLCDNCGREYRQKPCPADIHKITNTEIKLNARLTRRAADQYAKLIRPKLRHLQEAPQIQVPLHTGYYYLAAPFWHSHPDIRLKRFQAAEDAVIRLAWRGKIAISGVALIVRSYNVNIMDLNKLYSDRWGAWSMRYLVASSGLLLHSLDKPWQESAGCRKEFLTAVKQEIPIYTLNSDLSFRIMSNDAIRQLRIDIRS